MSKESNFPCKKAFDPCCEKISKVALYLMSGVLVVFLVCLFMKGEGGPAASCSAVENHSTDLRDSFVPVTAPSSKNTSSGLPEKKSDKEFSWDDYETLPGFKTPDEPSDVTSIFSGLGTFLIMIVSLPVIALSSAIEGLFTPLASLTIAKTLCLYGLFYACRYGVPLVVGVLLTVWKTIRDVFTKRA